MDDNTACFSLDLFALLLPFVDPTSVNIVVTWWISLLPMVLFAGAVRVAATAMLPSITIQRALFLVHVPSRLEPTKWPDGITVLR